MQLHYILVVAVVSYVIYCRCNICCKLTTQLQRLCSSAYGALQI